MDTPPELARRVVRGLLKALGASHRTPGTPLRLLDPACGTGELLLAAAAEMEQDGAPFELFGIEIDPKRAEIARERLSRTSSRATATILTGDALGQPWPPSSAILANPPWVSFSGREAAPVEAEHLRRHRELAGSLGRWPSLHGAFLARIAAHVEAERQPARVLLPASVAEQAGYGPLREETTQRARLLQAPAWLAEGAFACVTVPSLLLTLGPRPRAGRGSAEPWSVLDPAQARLIAGLRGFPRLAQEAFSDPGVHTGNTAKLLVRPIEPGLPGLREGRDLTPYHLGPPQRSLDVRVQAGDGRRFRYRPRERYMQVPILLRQTARRPQAALHTAPTFFRNSLLACTPPAELAPEFCVAVLNSTVAGAWHRLSFSEARQRAFPQVKIYHLRSLPFPFLARREAPTLHDALVEQVRAIDEESLERRSQEIDRLVFEAFGIEKTVGEELRAACALD